MNNQDELYQHVDGLMAKYQRTSDDVFKFLGRLTEEVGGLGIARFTGFETELDRSIQARRQRLLEQGLIEK